MSVYSSIEEHVRNAELRYHDNTDRGRCSSCGECCADLLPVSDQELRRLKEYATEHGLHEHRHSVFWDPGAVDLTCPFRNREKRICEVYEVRPAICRSFICSKDLDRAHADRDMIAANGRVYRSLRLAVFGNPEALRLFCSK